MLRPYLAEALAMKLLIAGGGTGGHVFPAIAIAREWLSRGSEREVVLVGTQRGIEMKLVPQAGLPGLPTRSPSYASISQSPLLE